MCAKNTKGIDWPHTLDDVVRLGEAHGDRDAFLREFLDGFYREKDPGRRAPMLAVEPRRSDEKADAYLAAVAEHLAWRYQLPVPAWTQDPSRFLRRPHFPCGLESLKATLLVESPPAFRRRLIFVGADPLYRPRRETPPWDGTEVARAPGAYAADGRLDAIDAAARNKGLIVEVACSEGEWLTVAYDPDHATRKVGGLVRKGTVRAEQMLEELRALHGWPENWLSRLLVGDQQAAASAAMATFGLPGPGLRVVATTSSYCLAMRCLASDDGAVEATVTAPATMSAKDEETLSALRSRLDDQLASLQQKGAGERLREAMASPTRLDGQVKAGRS